MKLRTPMDLRGKQVGMLTAMYPLHFGKHWYWACECACGSPVTILKITSKFNEGKNSGCGCTMLDARRKNVRKAIRAITTHGHSKTLIYKVYKNMKRRCFDKSNKRYKHYGGKGITICDEWLKDPGSFVIWAIENGYSPGLVIDRKDNNGHYDPDNCRFVDDFTSMNNTSRNHYITWEGETHTVAEWARIKGGRPQALQHRIDRKWTIERAMTEPFHAPGRSTA